jgi:hypothetical protein
MADDSTNIVRGRQGPIVVGNPYQIRFRESATELFPELKDWPLTVRATGEMAIEVPTLSLPDIQTTSQCFVNYIVFLNRQYAGPPRLSPFPKEEALRWFEQVIACGESEVLEAHSAALRTLLTAGTFELRYSDLPSAVNFLEGMIRGGF